MFKLLKRLMYRKPLAKKGQIYVLKNIEGWEYDIALVRIWHVGQHKYGLESYNWANEQWLKMEDVNNEFWVFHSFFKPCTQELFDTVMANYQKRRQDFINQIGGATKQTTQDPGSFGNGGFH